MVFAPEPGGFAAAAALSVARAQGGSCAARRAGAGGAATEATPSCSDLGWRKHGMVTLGSVVRTLPPCPVEFQKSLGDKASRGPPA